MTLIDAMPFLSPFEILVLLSACYYVWFISIAYRGLRHLQKPVPLSTPSRKVTVLVPARNEEAVIGTCLAALKRQDYPEALMEVIVIDDGSSDRTSAIVQEHRSDDDRFRLVKIEREQQLVPSTKRGRKPEALAAGLRASTGEVIITTDADCVHPSPWVRSMVARIDAGGVYVVGPVLEEEGPNVLTRLRALEVLGGMAITAGRIGVGRPINGHGGNTAFLKRLYEESGGFDFGAVKSDEETLMHRVVERGLGRVTFAATPDARVQTASPPTLGGFWNQRMRWGSMHRHFADKRILAQLAVLYVSILIPLVALLASPFVPSLFTSAIIAFGAKVSVDLLTLRLGAKLFGVQFSIPIFLLGQLFHSAYIVLFGAIAQFARYRWKDRTVLAR